MCTRFKNRISSIAGVLLLVIVTMGAYAQPSDLQPTFTGINGLPSSSINQIIKDNEDRIWIATELGLSIKNTTDPKLIALQKENSHAVKQIAFTNKYIIIALLDQLKFYEKNTLQLIKTYNAEKIGAVRKIRIIDELIWIITNKYVLKNSGLTLDSIQVSAKNKVALDIAKFNNQLHIITYPFTDLLTYNGKMFVEAGLTNLVSPGYAYNYLSLKTYNDTLFLGGDHVYAYLTKDKKVTIKDLEFRLNSNPSIWDMAKIGNRVIFAVGNSNQSKYGGVISPNLNDFHKFSKNQYAQCLYYDEKKDALWIGTYQDGVYLVPNARNTYYTGNAILEFSTFNNGYYLYDENAYTQLTKPQDEDLVTNSKIKQRYNGSLRKIKSINDTTYIMDIQSISMQSKNYYKEIWNSHAPKWGYYFTDCYRMGDSLYTFSLYYPSIIFNLKNYSYSHIGAKNDFPTTVKFGNNIYCHNQGLGFRVYNKTGVTDLISKNIRLENIEDFTVIHDTLFVLTKNTLQQLKIRNNELIALSSSLISDKIDGFNAKWIIASNAGKLYLIGETDIIRWGNNQPITHNYLGNGKLENKPVFDAANQLVISKGNYTSLLNERDLEYFKETNSFFINMPESIFESSPIDFKFSNKDYLSETHSLKGVRFLKNNQLVYEKYFLTNTSAIPTTLKHGTYQVIFLSADKEIFRTELSIKLPLDRNPLFYTAIGFGIIFIGFLFFKIKYNQKAYAKRILNNKIEMLQKNLNPHFIFNSLNLIYSNILSENKEDALKVLLNFSKLQRNFLERSKLKKVTLGSELDFIKSYMNLEISRYENDIKIDYILTVSPEVSLDKIFIPPNIFQPLIENAIKYGLLGYKGEEQKVIYIDIFRRDGIPVVSIQNPLEKGGGKKDITSSGMGLLIVKERIELYNQEMGVKLELKYDLPATDFKSGYRVEISIA